MPRTPAPADDNPDLDLEANVEGSEAKEVIFRPTVLVPEDGIPTYYTNTTQIVISPWDFTYRFAILDDTSGKTAALMKVGVVHSPPHAKAFLKLLQRQLEAYEQRFGPIADVSEGMLRKDSD